MAEVSTAPNYHKDFQSLLDLVLRLEPEGKVSLPAGSTTPLRAAVKVLAALSASVFCAAAATVYPGR